MFAGGCPWQPPPRHHRAPAHAFERRNDACSRAATCGRYGIEIDCSTNQFHLGGSNHSVSRRRAAPSPPAWAPGILVVGETLPRRPHYFPPLPSLAPEYPRLINYSWLSVGCCLTGTLNVITRLLWRRLLVQTDSTLSTAILAPASGNGYWWVKIKCTCW